MKPERPWLGLMLAGVAILFIGSLMVGFFGKIYMQISMGNQEQEKRDRNLDRVTDLHQIGMLLSDDPVFLEQVPESNVEICRHKAPDCSDLFDLSTLIDWDSMPYDEHSAIGNGTGYAIRKNKLANPAFGGLKTHTITLTALHAEGGEDITSTH